MKINKFIKMNIKMKNILPLNNFLLEEALPLNLAKKYVKMGEERNPATTAKMDVVFNKKQRLYLPVQKKVKSKIEPQIKEFLASIGYEIKNYVGNLAFKSDNPRREGRIGKLLFQNGRADLQDLFLKDPTRELATKQAEYSVVVSRHPYDIAGTSAGTGREAWHSSCLNINGGCNSHYIPAEIKNGTLVAYYIRTEDKNINKPLGRVNIKPYKKEEELDQKDKQKCYFPDSRVYGSFPPDAILALKEWIISWQGDLTGDFYKWKGCYNYDGTAYLISVGSNMNISQIEATKGDNNVDNFDIVNDLEEEEPPHFRPGHAYDQSDDVSNFWDYFSGRSSEVSVYDYNLEPEYLGDGNWTIDNGYIHFNVVNLVLDAETAEDISWGMDEYISCSIKYVENLTFKGYNFDAMMDFYSDTTLRVSDTLSFIDCDFCDEYVRPVSPGYIAKCNVGYRNFNIDNVTHLNIEGGDWGNALSILTIMKDIFDTWIFRNYNYLSGKTITLKSVDYAGIDDDNLKTLEDLILVYKETGATVNEIDSLNIEENK